MKLVKIILWIFGLAIVDSEKKEDSSTTISNNSPGATSPITPSYAEIIKEYRELRTSMDHNTAWQQITTKYKWSQQESEKNLSDINQYIQNSKSNTDTVLETPKEEKKDRTL